MRITKQNAPRLLVLIGVSLIVGYVITVFCSLFVTFGPTEQAGVYKAYCNGREATACVCPENPSDFGVISSGLPFISQKTVKYPCDTTEGATTEQYMYDAPNPVGGFWLDLAFWTALTGGTLLVIRQVKTRPKKTAK